MKITALALGAGLLLASCTAEAPSADPTRSPTPSASASASPSSTASATDLPFRPVNTVQAGTGAPGSVASLEVALPGDLAVALIAVDTSIGAVSWWDGFSWKSYEVDAALDARHWATDGHGGLIVQDVLDNIWHVPPFTDEPTMVVQAPPPGEVHQRLIGGGVLDGRSYAFVEQGSHGSPETATADIIGFDVEGRADNRIFTDTAGWESGTGEITIYEGVAVMTAHAECWTYVISQRIGSGDAEPIASGIDCGFMLSTAGPGVFSGPAAYVVSLSNDPTLPAALMTRDLGEFPESTVQTLPMHDDEWQRITMLEHRPLISARGVAIVMTEQQTWRRLQLDVPGVVAIADDLPIG